MSTTKLVRSLMIGAAILACFTMALPARASLPGNGGYGEWDTGVVIQASYYGTSIPLSGTPADTTCFLAGISGTLKAGTWAAVTPDPLPSGPWTLSVNSDGLGDEIEAKAVCLNLPFTYNVFNQDENGSQTLASTANGTQCMLYSVSTDMGEFANGATATIGIVGNNWVLSVSGIDQYQSSVEAVCFEVPESYYYWWNNWTGTYTVKRSTWPTFQDTAANPVACGLRGISGAFDGLAYDGVDMNWPSAWGGYWNMTATNGKDGWLTCLQ